MSKVFNTFIRRGQKETFALQGLHGKEICLLQDVRYESFGLPWDDWLTWGEGEEITVRLPRGQYDESKKYDETAPLFATMVNPFSYPLKEARETGRSVERENKQFKSRWAIIKFQHEIPVPERDVTIEPCPCCAAKWYAEVAADLLSEGRPQLTEMSSSSEPAVAHRSGQQVFNQLRDFMSWKQQGLLSDAEFEHYKQRIA
jgi:hypothetical protein